mgnify:CR=1 FL=1
MNCFSGDLVFLFLCSNIHILFLVRLSWRFRLFQDTLQSVALTVLLLYFVDFCFTFLGVQFFASSQVHTFVCHHYSWVFVLPFLGIFVLFCFRAATSDYFAEGRNWHIARKGATDKQHQCMHCCGGHCPHYSRASRDGQTHPWWEIHNHLQWWCHHNEAPWHCPSCS